MDKDNGCECCTCQGRDINLEGIKLVENEVLPFVKTDILKVRYPDHPLPFKYKGLLESLFAYSQALAYNRAYNIQAIYYTDNKHMLQFSEQLSAKFDMAVKPTSECPSDCFEVCEYNTLTN